MGKTQKAIEQIQGLIQKAEEIKSDYSLGKEIAEKELQELKVQFNELSERTKEAHKLYIRGQVTLDSYTDMKSELDVLQGKLKDAESKVSHITQYEIEDIKRVSLDIQKVLPELYKERDKAQKRLYASALEAKQKYLDAIQEASKECRDIIQTEWYSKELEIYSGRDDYNYVNGDGCASVLYNYLETDTSKKAIVTDSELKKTFYR